MVIHEKGYLDEEHVLVFDNAMTHLKWEEDALSAMKTPSSHPNWARIGVSKLSIWMKTAILFMVQMERSSRHKSG